MAAAYWSSADLKGIEFGGLIREDVMDKIWDISSIPLPFTDLAGSSTHNNSYFEWTRDKLAAPDIDNAVVDGSDAAGNNAAGGDRVGNQGQISVKELAVTERAQASNTIGRSQELSYQLMMRQRELRRDVEAIAIGNQGSTADDGDTVAGTTGALGAWLVTNTDRGAGGADGGFAAGTVTAPTPGAARALSETTVRDIAEDIYTEGGNTSTLMSVPGVIRQLSPYMFTSTANIATLQQSGQPVAPQTAVGSVNVFITDFGITLKMVPNRLQQTYTDAVATQVANVFFIDPALVALSFQIGYRTQTLAKTGLADKREIAVDWGLQVYEERGLGVIADIDPTLAAVA